MNHNVQKLFARETSRNRFSWWKGKCCIFVGEPAHTSTKIKRRVIHGFLFTRKHDDAPKRIDTMQLVRE